MKRILLILALVSVMAYSSAFAQLSLGGSLGFDYTTPAEDNSAIAVTLLPDLSYGLSSKLAVGGKLGFTYASKYTKADKTKTTVSEHLIVIAPYVRYNALGNDRLSLFFDAQLPLGFGSAGTEVSVSGKTKEIDGPSLFSFGLGVVPGLKVNLTSSFSLLATANVARLGFVYNKSTTKVGDEKVTSSGTYFELGVNKVSVLGAEVVQEEVTPGVIKNELKVTAQSVPFMIGIQYTF